MTKGRETTQAERIEVAKACIANGKNYGEVDVYRGTVLSGVSFFSRISTAVSTEGLAAACEGVLRIPTGACSDGFAIHNGDLVCEGALQTEGLRPAALDALCPYVFTVVGVTRNTSGRAPHIKVVCK